MDVTDNLILQVLGELHTLKNDPGVATNVCTAVRNTALLQNNSIAPQFFPVLLARFATLALASNNETVSTVAANASAALLTAVDIECATDFLAECAHMLLLLIQTQPQTPKRKPIPFLVAYEAKYALDQSQQQPLVKPPRFNISPGRKTIVNVLALIRAVLAVDHYKLVACKNERLLVRNVRTLWVALPDHARTTIASAISHPALIAGVSGALVANHATLLLQQFVYHIPIDTRTSHCVANRIAPALLALTHRNAFHSLTAPRAKTIHTLLQVLPALGPICPAFWARFAVPAFVRCKAHAHPQIVTALEKVLRNGLLSSRPLTTLSAMSPFAHRLSFHLFEIDVDEKPHTMAEKLIYNAIANETVQVMKSANNLKALQSVCTLTTTRAGLWPHSGTFVLWVKLVDFVLHHVAQSLKNCGDKNINFSGVCQLVACTFGLVRHVALAAPKVEPNSSCSDVSSGASVFPFRQPISIEQAEAWSSVAKVALDTLANALQQTTPRNLREHQVDFQNLPNALRQASSLLHTDNALSYVAPQSFANDIFTMVVNVVDVAIQIVDAGTLASTDSAHQICTNVLSCYSEVANIMQYTTLTQPHERIHTLVSIVEKYATQSPILAQAALQALAASISIDAKCNAASNQPLTCDPLIWRRSFLLVQPMVHNPDTDHHLCATAAKCIGNLAIYAADQFIEQAFNQLFTCFSHPFVTQARKNAFRALETILTTSTHNVTLSRVLLEQIESQLHECTQASIKNYPQVLTFIAALDTDLPDAKKASAIALHCLMSEAIRELTNIEKKLAHISPETSSTTLLENPNPQIEEAASSKSFPFYTQLLSLVNAVYQSRPSLLLDKWEIDAFEPWMECSLEAAIPSVHVPLNTTLGYDSEVASYLNARIKDWLPYSLERMISDSHYFSVLSALTMEAPDSLWKKTARYALTQSLLDGKKWIVKDLAFKLSWSEKQVVDRFFADIIAGIALSNPAIVERQAQEENETCRIIEEFMELPIKHLLRFKANKILQKLVLELGSANHSNAVDAITKLACRVCENPNAEPKAAVGELLSQHFLLVMDSVDHVLLDVHAEENRKIRYLDILQAVFKLANTFIGMYIYKAFSSLKVCLTERDADSHVKAKTLQVWATLISSLGVENVAPHLGSMLATFLPYVNEYSQLFVPQLLQLFKQGRHALEPYFDIIRLVFRTVKHRSLREIQSMLEETPTNVAIDDDVIMVDHEQSQANDLKTDLQRFSDRCKGLVDIATQHESQEIRGIALRQLLDTLKANRCHYDAILELLSNPVNNATSTPIFATLVNCLTALIAEAKHGCDIQALQCLGELGAIDPALITSHTSKSIKKPIKSLDNIHSKRVDVLTLAKHLLEDHLAPALWRIGPNDAAASRVNRVGLAIQELLKAVGCNKETEEFARRVSIPVRENQRDVCGIGFWMALNETTRTAAMSYLKEPFDPEKYKSVMGTGKGKDLQAACVPVWTKMKAEGNPVSLLDWRRQLVFQAIDYLGGESRYGKLLRAVRPALRVEPSVVEAIFPYVIISAVDFEAIEDSQDNSAYRFKTFVVTELHEALGDEGGAVQCAFAVIDTLRLWRKQRSVGRGRRSWNQRKQRRAKNYESELFYTELAKIRDALTSIVDITGEAHEQLSLLYQAKAALSAKSYARVILFAEQYVRRLRDESGNTLWASCIPKLLRRAETSTSQAGEAYRKEQEAVGLMQTAFAELEDADGVKGIAALRSSSSLRQHITDAEAAGNYDDALLIYERAFREDKDNEELQSGFLRCLCTLGHWETMLTHAVGLATQSKSHSMALNLGIEAAWRLGRWDKLEELCKTDAVTSNRNRNDSNQVGIALQTQADVGRSLLFVHQKKWNLVTENVRRAREEVLERVAHAAVEGYSRAYPLLVQTHALTDIEDLAELASNGKASQATRELARIDSRTKAASSSLKVREPLLSLRRSCLEILGDASSAANVSIELAQIARDNGNLRAASAAASLALSNATNDPDVSFVSAMEMARIQHATGDCAGALLRVKKLISEMSNGTDYSQGTLKKKAKGEVRFDHQTCIRLCAAHVLAGQWIEEARSESSEVILTHFDFAAELCPENDEAFYQLGRHYDYLLETATELNHGTSEVRYSRSSQSQASRSERRSSKMKRNHFEYVAKIIENFTWALKNNHSRLYEALPRLLTVWFDFYEKHSKARNKHAHLHAAEPGVNEAIREAFKSVPLYYFMTVVPQLLSRIMHPSKHVQEKVVEILARLLVFFPSQGVWLIAASSQIRSSSRKEQVNRVITRAAILHKKAMRRSSTSMSSTDSGSGRKSDLNKYIHNGLNVIKELIRICDKEPKGRRKTDITFVEEFKCLRRQMDKCTLMVPNLRDLTITLPSERMNSKKHNPFVAKPVTLSTVEDDVLVMNSLMAPRRISFLGSDGKQYRFLAKKEINGDMRKDSRLMDFVTVVNRLLGKDRQTRARDLKLTTYAVIPLTEQTGLIEWLNDLNPLRGVLRDELSRMGKPFEGQEVQMLYDRNTDKVNFLIQAFTKYPPILDKWFTRTFAGGDARKWLNARTLWCRSVAVWSITGYIIGLGDRHAENLLLETTTGRAVHVDFAMLFEKGRTLKVPEVVPFRLTPNIVAAFGIAGTEGPFKSACEIVLRVLRSNVEALMGTVEAFVHDPLFESGKVSDAIKTNAKVRDKLKGVVDASCIPLSVQGQVQKLIADATSHEKLSAMYIWWGAWM